MSEKVAVVLFNIGGPSGAHTIAPYLFNFFRDPNIIRLPNPFRWMLAKWISRTRSKGPAQKSYAYLGGISPLLANTQAQAAALEKNLCDGGMTARVFVSMRYWHPMSEKTAQDVAAWQPDKIVLLPLYPQYSTTTSFSSLQDWKCVAAKAGLFAPSFEVCCYSEREGFIKASSALVAEALAKAPANTRVLFSAHGLPENIIKAGDPYQYQCEKTAAAIARALNLKDWQLCYQSRVGRLKWISPSTEEALAEAVKDKVGVLIYPLAFVSEHVETLVEIDIEYREKAQELGIPYFARVPTASIHPDFIATLAEAAKEALQGKSFDTPCPPSQARCYCRDKERGAA